MERQKGELDLTGTVTVPLVLEPGVELPGYQSEGAAGIDLCANEDFELAPGERRMVATGVKVAIPAGFEGQVRPRSGLASRLGLGMVNSPGTIDSDYRGEIKVILINLGDADIRLGRGERIAQLVICPVLKVRFEVVNRLEETSRGEGGFGSTGQ